MGQLIVQLIPVALGVVLSPFAIMALVAVLLSRLPRVNGIAYLLGWTVGIVGLLALFLWLFASLEVRTKQSAPFDWAETMRNLGVAQKLSSELTGDPVRLDAAIESYQAALTVFSRDSEPMDWAQAQADLGIAALARADRTRRKADLLLARDAYAAAYEVYRHMGNDYAAYFESKLKDIDEQLKR